jgi:dihydrodipicolinate synthase/N-acetylneuraminate lyase
MLDGGQLSLYKAMLTRRGIPAGGVRPPLLPADEELASACWQALGKLSSELRLNDDMTNTG